MADPTLTDAQCRLLQRHFDGEATADERARAEALLGDSPAARVLVAALEEVRLGVRAVEALAWDRAEAQTASPDEIARLAAEAGALIDEPIAELAPLLERYHDGEVDPVEAAIVGGLAAERDDVADYLAALGELGEGVRVVGDEVADEVDFSGFWDGIATGIAADAGDADSAGDDASSVPASLPDAAQGHFDPDHHLVLVQRYHDGEVTAAEAARVERWIETDHDAVCGYLDALGELALGVRAGVETAQEGVDLHAIWDGVAAEIGRDDSVVSLADRRADKRFEADQASWWARWGQSIIGAAAAVLLVAGVLALFGDRIFETERVVEKTVVIVDSVEYAPGSSVMITSPVEQVGMQTDDSARDDEAEDTPTVIWLLDNGQAGQAAPAGGGQADEPAAGPDAGENDDAGDGGATRPDPYGQPI